MKTDVSAKIERFFASYPLQKFDKRHILIQAEESPDEVFYVVEGRANQYDITPAGNEVVVNIFKPGAFFPMSSVINKTPNHYFFETGTALKAHKAPAADVLEFLNSNPDVVFDLLSRVYRGVDGVLRRMAHLMGGDAKTRLLFELLNAAYRFGEPQTDGSILILLSEGDLAKHSGLARETVSRTIQDFKTKGLVSVTSDGIHLPDTAKLEALLSTTL